MQQVNGINKLVIFLIGSSLIVLLNIYRSTVEKSFVRAAFIIDHLPQEICRYKAPDVI